MKKQETNRERLRLYAAIGLLIYMIVWRLVFLSPYARTWDEVDFALAIERFDLLAMQPHFPGYPYFILGGMLLRSLGIHDAVQALSAFNVIVSASSVLPVYWIGRRQWTPSNSLWLALLVTSPAYMWTLTVIPMSEATAVAVLWWYLWSVCRGMEQVSWGKRFILPLFFFGVLMGVRVSFAPFGFGLLLLALRDRCLFPAKYKVHWLWAVLLAIAFQMIWIGGLIGSEGSISGFVAMAKGFVFGHFEDWGGSIVTSADPLAIRAYKLIVENWLWSGMMAHSSLLAAVYAISVLLLLFGVPYSRSLLRNSESAEESNGSRRFTYSLMAMLLLYFLWALLGQNIDKPRHIAPLIGGISFLLFRCLMNSQSRKTALLWVVVMVLAQSGTGAMLVQRQAPERPAVYQMADVLSERTDRFTLYTWEETRVLQYIEVKFPHQRVLTYALFQDRMHAAKSEKVLLTDHVLAGFEQQAGNLSDKVRLIAEFRSEPLFDPVYSHIRLYEWID